MLIGRGSLSAKRGRVAGLPRGEGVGSAQRGSTLEDDQLGSHHDHIAQPTCGQAVAELPRCVVASEATTTRPGSPLERTRSSRSRAIRPLVRCVRIASGTWAFSRRGIGRGS